jgi:predicted metal-dependent phosphoesterase TrpH
MWKVDLHCHTRYSSDSLADPVAVLEAARRRGLDKVAITEHNSLRGALAAFALAPDLVIVGEEIQTDAGELIAYFVTEEVPRGLSLQEAIARLRAQGAVISVSHPRDRWRRSAVGEKTLLTIIERVDAVEVWNARCLLAADNAWAAAIARKYGKLATAGSDAHTPGEVGMAYVELPPFTNAEEMRASLAQAKVVGRLSPPWVHWASTWAKVWKRVARAGYG